MCDDVMKWSDELQAPQERLIKTFEEKFQEGMTMMLEEVCCDA